MNVDSFREKVSLINDAVSEIVKERDHIYSVLAGEIKDSFSEYGNPVPHIHVDSDASRIVVSWFGNQELNINPSIIEEIGMSFDFNKELTTDGTWRKQLIFYPFKEGD